MYRVNIAHCLWSRQKHSNLQATVPVYHTSTPCHACTLKHGERVEAHMPLLPPLLRFHALCLEKLHLAFPLAPRFRASPAGRCRNGLNAPR